MTSNDRGRKGHGLNHLVDLPSFQLSVSLFCRDTVDGLNPAPVDR